MKPIPKAIIDHPVAKVCGVTADDTRVQAAEKAIAVMKMAGMSRSAIRKAEAMLADYKARNEI